MKIGSDVSLTRKLKRVLVKSKRANIQRVKQDVDKELLNAEEHAQDVQQNWKRHNTLQEAQKDVNEASADVRNLKLLQKATNTMASVEARTEAAKTRRKAKAESEPETEETEEGGKVYASKSKYLKTRPSKVSETAEGIEAGDVEEE